VYECGSSVDGTVKGEPCAYPDDPERCKATGERVKLNSEAKQKQKTEHSIDDPYKVIYSRTMAEIKYYYEPASKISWTRWFARFGKATDIVSRGVRAGYHGKSMSISIPSRSDSAYSRVLPAISTSCVALSRHGH
jgi:hypothetical protein